MAVWRISTKAVSYTHLAASGDVLWNVTDADGNGTFVQGGVTTDYTGLAAGLRGDTSTKGTRCV